MQAKLIRRGARSIPGVPIVYVKRSVMIIEPMSAPSESTREGVEKSKFRAGMQEERPSSLGKRKRKTGVTASGTKRAKGPNPLSIKRPKRRVNEGKMEEGKRKGQGETQFVGEDKGQDRAEPSARPRRRRRHHKSSGTGGDGHDVDDE